MGKRVRVQLRRGLPRYANIASPPRAMFQNLSIRTTIRRPIAAITTLMQRTKSILAQFEMIADLNHATMFTVTCTATYPHMHHAPELTKSSLVGQHSFIKFLQDLIYCLQFSRVIFLVYFVLPEASFNLSFESSTTPSILLPRHQLLIENAVALVQSLASVVSRLFDEQMGFQHLLRHELWQVALVCLLVDPNILRLLARSLRKLVQDFTGRVVTLSAENTSTKHRRTVLDDGFDEFA